MEGSIVGPAAATNSPRRALRAATACKSGQEPNTPIPSIDRVMFSQPRHADAGAGIVPPSAQQRSPHDQQALRPRRRSRLAIAGSTDLFGPRIGVSAAIISRQSDGPDERASRRSSSPSRPTPWCRTRHGANAATKTCTGRAGGCAFKSGGRNIPADALDCVWGYGVGIDLTRRDLQIASRDKAAGRSARRSTPRRPPADVSEPDQPPQERPHRPKCNGSRQDGDLEQMI